jgi:hypothetical protein
MDDYDGLGYRHRAKNDRDFLEAYMTPESGNPNFLMEVKFNIDPKLLEIPGLEKKLGNKR